MSRLAAFLTIVLTASAASAQSLEGHAFFDVGLTRFTASQSFEAVFGSANGFVFGGGGGIVLPNKIFIDARASRFQKDGERVFVADNGDVFKLGISNTISITPIDITAGYRFGQTRDTMRPYAGGGISFYRYSETDEFATSSEDVSTSYTGFHLLGGIEFRVTRWVAFAGEVSWAAVPNALGQNPTSVGTGFRETDLGGTTFRAKMVFGR